MSVYIYSAESVRKQYSLCLNPEHRLARTLADLELELTVYVMNQIDCAAGDVKSSVVVFPQVGLAESPQIKQISVVNIHKIYRKVLEAFRIAGYDIKIMSGIWMISWADA